MNSNTSRAKCRKILEELYQPIADKIKAGEYAGGGCYILYENEYNALLKAYHDSPNKGPCAEEVLAEFNKNRETEKITILKADKVNQHYFAFLFC